jgi:hypothetical protein
MPDSAGVYFDVFFATALAGLLALSYYSFDSTMKDINTFIDFEAFKKSVNSRIEKLS